MRVWPFAIALLPAFAGVAVSEGLEARHDQENAARAVVDEATLREQQDMQDFALWAGIGVGFQIAVIGSVIKHDEITEENIRRADAMQLTSPGGETLTTLTLPVQPRPSPN